MNSTATGPLPLLPFFLPASGGQRYCLLHLPPPGQASRGGIVYLHPFAEELNKSRHVAAAQARAFAAAGYSVLQIDLYGCGDSSGDFAEARWAIWHNDLHLACAWLAQRVDGPLTLWGLRLGALLALVAGLGRTTLAMAREHDLPHWLAAVHPRFQVPHRAELVLGAGICLIIAFADLRGAIGFSSFGVLVYYLVANLAAFTQASSDRRYPRFLQLLGGAACIALLATLPLASILAGLAMFGLGIAYRALRLRRANAGTG